MIMAKCDVYLSYSAKDGREYADTLTRLLEERGISVWADSKMLTSDMEWVTQIEDAISSCQYSIPIITDA